MSERLSFAALAERMPEWCQPGKLVWVDPCYLEGEAERHRLGLVLNYWIIDIEQVDDEEYNNMMVHDEWMVFDIHVDNTLLECVFIYAIEEFNKMEIM
ncbi:MAG: hypothetical protein CBB97_00465 [Candidatus Endolissoclinum sp. TMED37]|nr:MAG: hypothetical protein CBB97_00465 [Candidatus Endolissoclinum sp. TMED37]|tara:strand:+ start:550 stop:843 length:294 start_codon:yes stop_codon:yes gene_type:complete